VLTKKTKVEIFNEIIPLNLKLQNNDRNINSLLGQYKNLKVTTKFIETNNHCEKQFSLKNV